MGVRAAIRSVYRRIRDRRPKICLCILMNHPYPRNLPLLREIYLGKFSYLRFLIPFERLDDSDVITVYRGSYTHAGYITDAYEKLAQLDCDHFIFCHDDVLLNPQLNDRSFYEFFPIGQNDGFIADVVKPPIYAGDWSWYFGMIPKLFHPKSMLFGTGIEPVFLAKHLPSARIIEDKIIQNGIDYVKEVRFTEHGMGEIEAWPSRLLFEGFHTHTDLDDPRRGELDALNLSISRKLIKSLKLSSEISGQAHDVEKGEQAVDLPIPLVTAGSFADLYIVPSSGLKDYAHYVGVASAANLFVEVLAPTLLIACCDRVWRAEELGLDAAALRNPPEVEAMADRRIVGINPFKMASMTNVEKRALLVKLRTIAGDANPQMPVAQPGGPEGALFDLQGPAASGWHGPEAWGAWTCQTSATVSFHYDPRVSLDGLKLQLSFPTHPSLGRLSGWVALNGKKRRISAHSPQADVEVKFAAKNFRRNAPNIIEIHADSLMTPSKLKLECSDDERQLGIGLKRLLFF